MISCRPLIKQLLPHMNFSNKFPKKYYSLPSNGKRIFKKFYDRSLQKYKSERIALKLACCAVRKKYIFINNKWHVRSEANNSDTTSSSESSSDITSSTDTEDD